MQNKILVIGDTILDEYIYVDPIKISDEAHVITSNIVNKKYVLGGGSNVARNIASLGGECTYLGLTSEHVNNRLLECMSEYDLKPILFNTENSVQIKTRVISTRGSQINRFDSIFNQSCDNNIVTKITKYLEENLNQFNFLVISKYYDFFLTPDLIKKILELAKKYNIKVIVDNRQKNISDFKDADFYKLNFNEFHKIYNCDILDNTFNSIKEIILKNGMLVNCLIITRSSLPTIVCKKNNDKIEFAEVKVKEVDVRDVSGAGDTFVASFSINFKNDHIDLNSIVENIYICHDVCNLVIKKMGTSVVWAYELNSDLPLSTLCEQLKKNSKKIVFTNGVFDILHIGHIKLLKEAKSFGDYLIVGINSDESVRKIKGSNRPINPENNRKIILEAIKFVDKVIIFNDETVSSLLEEIKPNIYVKGGDYTLENIPEKNSLKYVGKVHFIDIVEGKSSTDIINKLKEL